MNNTKNEERKLVWGNTDLRLCYAAQLEGMTVREYVIRQARRMMDYYGLEEFTFFVNSNPRLKRWGLANFKERYIELSESRFEVLVEELVTRLCELIACAIECKQRGIPSMDYKWKCRYATMLIEQLGVATGEVLIRQDYYCRRWASKILHDVEQDRRMPSREQLLALLGNYTDGDEIEED